MALKVRVLEKYCKGCGYCIQFCPKKVLEAGKKRNALGAFVPVVTVSYTHLTLPTICSV